MEAISGRKTIQEIAADHSIHPIPPLPGKMTPLHPVHVNHQGA
jgi:hypothetical protein